MNQKFILHTLLFSVIVSLTLTPVFAEIEFDSGPLQEKPLDQREQEDQDTTDIWMYAIALVIVFVIIRVAFKIIKKRMKPKKD
jgi:multidrug efflux pump subunit AcrB